MRLLLLFVSLLSITSRLRAAEDAVLTVKSLNGSSTTFTAAELAAFPHIALTAADPHEKKDRHYSGIALTELLAKAGAPFGEKLRGASLQIGVLFRSKDGYGVLFSLAEFDESFSSRQLILADKLEGQPLPANAAPLQLIAPGDKKGARWARMVTSIELITVGTTPPSVAHP